MMNYIQSNVQCHRSAHNLQYDLKIQLGLLQFSDVNNHSISRFVSCNRVPHMSILSSKTNFMEPE